jgi:hypothetical protein
MRSNVIAVEDKLPWIREHPGIAVRGRIGHCQWLAWVDDLAV